jgi:hypothetical protein
MTREYLGDGVYATIDLTAANPIILTTGHHNPAHADNVIYLECVHLLSIAELVDREREAVKRA